MDAMTLPQRLSDLPTTHSPALTEQFLDFLGGERCASRYTVKSYRADLHQFGRFLSGTIGPRKHVEGLSCEDLDRKFLACTR